MEPTDPSRDFLLQVFDSVGADTARSVSLFEIGATLGWDREVASRTAQDLMGLGWIEVRTLSGAIGLSAAGADAARAARGVGPEAAGMPLGQGRVMTRAECGRAADVCAGIRAETAETGCLLPETEADLRTLTAQIASPSPKTAIVRACLRSLLEALGPEAHRSRAAVSALLGQ